jgi:hypothetical protein
MTYSRDGNIPYWLSTVPTLGLDDGIPRAPIRISLLDDTLPFPYVLPFPPPPAPPPGGWPSSRSSRPAPTYMHSDFASPPTRSAPSFPPASPIEHLDSGKYWPVGPAPAGANEQTPAHGFYSPPVPQAPSWGQEPAYPIDNAAPSLPQSPRTAGIAVPSIEHLDSAKYWAALPLSTANVRPLMHGFYPSPLPQAPSWNSVPTYPADLSPQLASEPQRRSSWSASAGSADGERGTRYAGETEIAPEVLSDVTPDNYWIPGADYAADGHHDFPQAHYRRMPPETRKVFDEAKTGRLFVRSIGGRRHEFDAFHREYNKATGELLERFMRENNGAKRPEQMTPDHARAVLKAIAESEDPRIRHYAEFIRRLRLFYRLRGGDQ